jgi:hypothetical protein
LDVAFGLRVTNGNGKRVGSVDLRISGKPSTDLIMLPTCFLSAPPRPVTDRFTLRGVYS